MDWKETTYSWIEQPSTNPEEHPHAHHQTESKHQTDIQQHTRIRRLRNAVIPTVLSRRRPVAEHSCRISNLRPPECEEEEHEGPAELGESGDEFVAPFSRHVGGESVPACMGMVAVVVGLF